MTHLMSKYNTYKWLQTQKKNNDIRHQVKNTMQKKSYTSLCWKAKMVIHKNTHIYEWFLIIAMYFRSAFLSLGIIDFFHKNKNWSYNLLIDLVLIKPCIQMQK